jgi:hypothetical protein
MNADDNIPTFDAFESFGWLEVETNLHLPICSFPKYSIFKFPSFILFKITVFSLLGLYILYTVN